MCCVCISSSLQPVVQKHHSSNKMVKVLHKYKKCNIYILCRLAQLTLLPKPTRVAARFARLASKPTRVPVMLALLAKLPKLTRVAAKFARLALLPKPT